ncbi:hypothetical protein Tco_0173125 [Tanacetum coccineum]
MIMDDDEDDDEEDEGPFSWIKPGRYNKEKKSDSAALGQHNLLRKMIPKFKNLKRESDASATTTCQLITSRLDADHDTREACVWLFDAQSDPDSEHSEQSTDNIPNGRIKGKDSDMRGH